MIVNTNLLNLLNKTNLVYNLFLVYLSISTCFRRLCVWMTVWYAGAYAPAYRIYAPTYQTVIHTE